MATGDRASNFSRRNFLRLAAGGAAITAAGSLLAACGAPAASPTAAPKAAEPTKAPAAAEPTKAPAAAPTQAPAATQAAAPTAAAKPTEAAKPAAAAGAKTSIKVIFESGATLKAAVDDMKKEFESKNPNITVSNEEFSGGELATKIMVMGQAKDQSIDVWITGCENFLPFMRAGLLEPLDPWIDRKEFDQVFPAEKIRISIGETDKKIYAVPGFADCNLWLINRKMYTDAGLDPNKVPTKLEDAVEAMKAMTKQSGAETIWGNIFPGQKKGSDWGTPIVDWMDLLLAHGGDMIDAKEYPNLNTDAVKAAFQVEYDMVNTWKVVSPGVMAMNGTECTDAVKNGKAAGYVYYPGNTPTLIQGPALKSVDDMIFTLPPFYNKMTDYKRTGSWLGGRSWGMNKFIPQDRKEAAGKYIAYAFTDEGQVTAGNQLGQCARIESVEKLTKKYPYLKLYPEAWKFGKTRPQSDKWVPMMDEVITAKSQIIRKEKKIDDAVKELQARVEKIYGPRPG